MVGRLAGFKNNNLLARMGSVRATSRELTGRRYENQDYLSWSFMPTSDPFGDVINHTLSRVRQLDYPIGSNDQLQWLHSKVQDPRMADRLGLRQPITALMDDDALAAMKRSLERRGIGGDDESILMSMPKGSTFGVNRDGSRHEDTGKIAIAPQSFEEVTPYSQMQTLAHEVGHLAGGHVYGSPSSRFGDNSRLPLLQKEVEAEAIAYGVTNRLFPYQKSQLHRSGEFLQQAQASAEMAEELHGLRKGSQNIDLSRLVDYDEGARDRVDAIVNALVPNPRKPFEGIVPGAYPMGVNKISLLKSPVPQIDRNYSIPSTAAPLTNPTTPPPDVSLKPAVSSTISNPVLGTASQQAGTERRQAGQKKPANVISSDIRKAYFAANPGRVASQDAIKAWMQSQGM